MTDQDALRIATDVLYREALYLDERRWDDWLDLYHADAEFWVPMWKSEHEFTDNPSREVSLIYIASRDRLEERVKRVRSNRSAASMPLPRTAHTLSNIVCDPESKADRIGVRAIATTQVFDVKRRETSTFYSRAEYHLVPIESVWRIRKKKLVLLNDYIQTAVDFYCL